MKVIFLDIDGVLNVASKNRDEFGQIFTERFVNNLSFIIACTKAKIVISSTWRMRGLDWIKQLWEHRNLPGEVIGITTDCAKLIAKEKFEFHDQVERGHEIQEWIDEHPELSSYVILDDDNDMLQSQRFRFVRTANNINHPDCEDRGYGLTKTCAEKAIRILNN